MAIQGLRDTADFVTDQRPKNWREGVLLRYPNGMAPLFALTAAMKKKATDDPEFNWWSKDFPQQRLVLTTAINNTDVTTALAFAGGGTSQLKKDHVLLVEHSGEQVLVTTNPTTDTAVTVSRGFAGTTKTAVNPATAGHNVNVLVIGTAHMEGSLPPAAISYNPTKSYNWTQIFRNTLSMTRTAKQTRLRTGDQVKESKRECMELHSVEIERAFWFGKPSEDLAGTEPRRTTGGVLHWIDPANIHDYSGGTTTLSNLEDDLEKMFRWGAKEKMAFCGNEFALTLQRIIRKNSDYQFMQGQKEFGMSVLRLVCPFGTLVIKTHPLFTLLTSGTTAGTPYYGMNASAVVLDMSCIVYRPLQDTMWEPDIQTNGLDGLLAGYLTEAGLELHHPSYHFWLKGVHAAAVDA